MLRGLLVGIGIVLSMFICPSPRTADGKEQVDGQWVACLHDAATAGSDCLIHALIGYPENIPVRRRLLESRDRRTALEKAIVYGHGAAVEVLKNPESVRRGEFSIPFGMLDHRHIERLHDATMRGDVEEIKRVISWNTSETYPGHLKQFVVARDDRTAIVKAAQKGHGRVVGLLLQAGANANVCNGDALKEAARNGHVEVVRLLVGPSVRHVRGQALALAARERKLEVVRVLCAHRIDALCKNWALEKAVQDGHAHTVSALCNGGADPTAHDACGESMLSLAITRGFIDVARVLRLAGAQEDRVTQTVPGKAWQAPHAQSVRPMRQTWVQDESQAGLCEGF